MSVNTILDQNLRYISVRSQWGCQPIPNNIITLEDKGSNSFNFFLNSSFSFSSFFLNLKNVLEYIMAVGCRVSLLEEDIGPTGSKKLLYPGPEVSYSNFIFYIIF